MTNLGKRVERLERDAPKATDFPILIKTIVAPDGSDAGRGFARLIGFDCPRIDRMDGEPMASFEDRVATKKRKLQELETKK